MPRNLPDDFFENTNFQRLLANIVRDRELFPEIRDGVLTVYYRGSALIRDLGMKDGQIVGNVHYKYVPLRTANKSDYVTLQLNGAGLSLPQGVTPIPIGFGDQDVLAEYKRTMALVRSGPEFQIVHRIVCRPENRIVDQEVKFQVPGKTESDKIDVCHFDTHLGCLAFVEVKGIHDKRLVPDTDDDPEVVHQLRRYCHRIEENRTAILSDYQAVLVLKNRLGLGDRLKGIPSGSPTTLLKKPVLVIGHCSREDVVSIQNRHEKWLPLLDGLQHTAAGLILCGHGGCGLSLERRRQVTVIDESVL